MVAGSAAEDIRIGTAYPCAVVAVAFRRPEIVFRCADEIASQIFDRVRRSDGCLEGIEVADDLRLRRSPAKEGAIGRDDILLFFLDAADKDIGHAQSRETTLQL